MHAALDDIADSISSSSSEFRKQHSPRPSNTFKLPSGHELAYDEYGSNFGYPLIYFHDSGSSRLECSFFHNSARRLGYRLIAVDRPGIGCSNFYSLRSCDQFCEDIVLLADSLGLERFGVMSLGAGGVYGLSLAHMAPHRVDIQLLLAGIPGKVFSDKSQSSYLAKCVNGLTPTLVKLLVNMKQTFFPLDAEEGLQRLQEYLSYTDRKVLARPRVIKILTMDQTETVRQGSRGIAQDAALCFRKLDFSLAAVEVPALIWQGSADRLSQRSDCEYLVSNLPAANFYRVSNGGHFFFLQNMDEVFSRLRTAINPGLACAA